MRSCSKCGKSWPENYCPECCQSIGPVSAPPPLPPPLPGGPSNPHASQPPPIPSSSPPKLFTASGKASKDPGFQWKIFGSFVLLFLLIGSYYLYREYGYHQLPQSYRNRPFLPLLRYPGIEEFGHANDHLDRFTGTVAFGNSTQAIDLARQFATDFKAARNEFFTHGILQTIGIDEGQFLTFCELHENECVFLVYVPGLRHYQSGFAGTTDARKGLGQTAWLTAQHILKANQAGTPQMELAVGLRGIAEYGPITLGYYVENPQLPENAGIIKYLDADRPRFLAPFFAPSTNRPATKTE